MDDNAENPLAPPKPKGRSTAGFLILLTGLTLYAFVAAAIGDLMVDWPLMIQLAYYGVAGIVWIFPAGRVLRWALTDPANTQQSDQEPKG